MSGSIFRAGVPTAPDVRKLIDAFGVPSEGTLISYHAVEEVIGCRPGTCRFNTVTHCWRKQLLKLHNVVIGVEDKQFKALSPPERVSRGSQFIKVALRSVRRNSSMIDATDRSRLTPELRQEADHLVMCSASMLMAARRAASNQLLAPPDACTDR